MVIQELEMLCISQVSLEKQNQYRDLLQGIASHNDGGDEVPRAAVCDLGTQESKWYGSSPSLKECSSGGRAGEDQCLNSTDRRKEKSPYPWPIRAN